MRKKPISKKRALLYTVTALLFAMVSVFIIFSAMGYELKFKKKEIVVEKTGMLIISSRPSGADIYLNGRKSDQKTNLIFSVKLDKLLEGTYTLKIQKEGFYSWQKDVKVLPEIVTWANYVLLFPKKPKIEKYALKGSFTDALSSDDHRSAVIRTEHRGSALIYLLENTTGKYRLLLDTGAMSAKSRLKNIAFLEWSKDKKKLLIEAAAGGKSHKYILDTESGKITKLDSISSLNFKQLTFNDVSSNEFFGISSRKLYRVDVAAGSAEDLQVQDILRVSSVEDRVYYLKKSLDSVSLMVMRSDASGKKVLHDKLPLAGSYKIAVAPKGDDITVQTDKDEVLYLLKKKADGYEMTRLKNKVSFFSWSPEGKRLLLRSGNTLFAIDFEEEKTYTIRNADKLRDIRWYDNRHFTAQRGRNAVVMDFDGANVVSLGESVSNSKIFFSGGSKDIYFFSPSKKKNQFILSRYKVEF